MTDDVLLRRFSAFVDLTAAEMVVLRRLHEPPVQRVVSERITTEGDEPSCLFLLHGGWVLSSVNVRDGGRQVVKVHRPGDIMGTLSLPFTTSMESLTALTVSEVSSIPLERIGALFAHWPRLGAVLFLLGQEERTALTMRLVGLGRLDARQSFVELLLAIHKADPAADGGARVYLPLTQAEIGDVLGLSTVHVNRVIGALEQGGFIHHGKHVYDLIDVARLEAFVGLPRQMRSRDLPWLPSVRS